MIDAIWPYVTIAAAGWLATDFWRWLGVMLSTRVEETSEIFVWVKAVATALVAGVVARLILFPAEPLASVPVELRVGAVAIGFGVFWFGGRGVFLGVLVTEIVLIGGGWLLT